MKMIQTKTNKDGEEYTLEFDNIATDKSPVWQWDGQKPTCMECDVDNDETIKEEFEEEEE